MKKAFQDLKSYRREIPLLTRPKLGEVLYMYLGVSNAALSFVFLRKEGSIDKPIYYMSKVLQGVESCYSHPEKVALALVMA